MFTTNATSSVARININKERACMVAFKEYLVGNRVAPVRVYSVRSTNLELSGQNIFGRLLSNNWNCLDKRFDQFAAIGVVTSTIGSGS